MLRKMLICNLLFVQMMVITSTLEASRQYRITGHIIAKDPYFGLAHLSSTTNVELFILKVDRTPHGTSLPRFIKVRYESYGDQARLPTELLEGKSQGIFSLTRDKSCDQVVSEGLLIAPASSETPPKAGTFILAQNAGQDIPSIQTRMPCFILRSGGVKLN